MSAVWTSARFQQGNSCAQMGRGVVKNFQHQRVAVEGLLDDASLHAPAAAMDETDLGEPGGVRLVDVLFDHGWNVPRRKGVEVEAALDRDAERVLILHVRLSMRACRSVRSLRS